MNFFISDLEATLRLNWLERLKVEVKRVLGKNIFLCDSCQYDWRGACRNPARPSATSCPDYKKRGK